MKIKIMGTAAYERVPAMFCTCAACEYARKHKGKAIRTQAQTLINDDLLVDFGQDNYIHYLNGDYDYTKLRTLIVTHAHSDHFMTNELLMTSGAYGHNEMENITVVGAKGVQDKYEQLEGDRKVDFLPIKPYETLRLSRYEITALPAQHGTEVPVCYIVSDGEKTVLYNHDTSSFPDEVYDFIKKGGYRFDIVIADCTYGLLGYSSHGHMSLEDNEAHKARLSAIGALDEKSVYVITHYSHNALMHKNGSPATPEQLEEIAAARGMISAYDGIAFEI